MALCRTKNSLGRRTCSYGLTLLVLASIILYYFLGDHIHRQSHLVSDIYLHPDTSVRWLPEKGETVQLEGPPLGRQSSKTTHSASRFIIGLNYWEQLTMATVNMFQLVCLADSWNASVVRPFTQDSRLYGLQNLKAGKFWRNVKYYVTNVLVQKAIAFRSGIHFGIHYLLCLVSPDANSNLLCHACYALHVLHGTRCTCECGELGIVVLCAKLCKRASS